jgi:Icc-related predicted phosphoesterase
VTPKVSFLLAGDFHGKVPNTLSEKLSSRPIDACLCIGDLCEVDRIRQVFLSHLQELRQGESVEDIFRLIPPEVHSSSIDSMQPVLDFLAGLGVPVFLVPGNADYLAKTATMLPLAINKALLEERISTTKNIHLLDKEIFDFAGYQILGYSGLEMVTTGKQSEIQEICRNELEQLSSNVVNWRRVIFLAHLPPYGILDEIRNPRGFPETRHGGSKPFLQFIIKWQPLTFVCGHIHEQQGKANIDQTLVINVGFGGSGQAAILTLINGESSELEFFTS